MIFDPPHALIDAIKRGDMVVLLDDEDRENEGDLVMAAQAATPAHVNFMVREGRGLVCLTMPPEQADRLHLKLQQRSPGTRRFDTQFLTSIEAASGVTTGVSAFDRAYTLLLASDPKTQAHELVTPGHVFPIQAHPDGLKGRLGHTEASVCLAERAGWSPCGVLCEIMSDDGSMARAPELFRFARTHNLLIGTVRSLYETLIATPSSLSQQQHDKVD